MKKILSKKFGKLLATGSVFLFVFVLWFGLAVFYRTDIGMPIGVQNYLFHKYHEEFDVNGFFGATIAGHPTNQLTCCPKDGNPTTDAFNVVRKNTFSIGSRRFASDNYYGIIIRDDYEKYVSDIVSKYFDEFKVFVRFEFSGLSNTKYMSDEFDKNTSLEDFFNYQKNSDNIRACNYASIDIFLKEQPAFRDKDNVIKKIQSFCSDLQNKLIYVNVDFAVFDKDSKYNYDSLTVDTYYAWNNPNNWDYSPQYITFGLNHKSEIIYFVVDEQFFILKEK